jgi:lysophospholipase L1-like esterase
VNLDYLENTMKKNQVVLSVAIVCSALFIVGAIESSVTVFSIGDSTMALYDTSNNNQQRGWGQMLPQFFDNEVTVVDAARGGRSSKSFYDEGLWSAVINQVKTGDYVFIQFAHNDEKTDTAYYTDPWTSYTDYLTRYVTETRARGGIPVFFTPICRRYFGADGKITATGQQIATFSPIIIVRGGQTLSIRLYAWCSTASKYFTSKSMSISGTTSIDTLFSTSVKELKSEKPASYVLFQNYPNPFNPSTTIEYQIPSGGTHNFVSLQVFDILGREVATLVNGTKPPGNHSVQWNAEKISSGVYFYCFHIGSFTETKKLLLLK